MSSGIVESSNQGSGQQQQGQQGAGKRSKLVERLLDASANLPAFMKDLLGTMAVTVAGTEAAGFLIEQQQSPQGGAKPGLRTVTHIRPDDSDDEVRAAALRAFSEIIIPCVEQGKDGAIEVGAAPDDGEPQFCLVTLLRDQGQAVAAAAVITRCRDHERARQRLMSMQLVAGYFELFMLRRQMDQSKELARRHQDVLQLTTTVATAEGFEAAAMNFCNELATRAGASRVSVGWMKGNHIKVRALSHTEKFDKKQELIVQLQRVMEECIDQEEPVRFDADGTRSQNVTRESEALCRTQGNASVYSVPLRRRTDIVGVVTLEYTPPNKLSDEVASALAVTADLLAPQLWDRHENDRWITVKIGKSIQKTAKLAIGPKHMLAKLLILLVAAIGATLYFWQPMYRVSAPFQFVSARKQTFSAPYDGAIAKVNVKAGQRFTKGQVLAEMDTVELQKQLARAKADEATNMQDYQREFGNREDPDAPSRALIARLKAQSARADAELYEEKLSRSRIVAEFDGVVLKGELEDKVNMQVRQGDPLMEVHEVNQALKAELAVAERDIHLLKQMPQGGVGDDTNGWTGLLATNALPSDDIGFKVERIVPASEANPRETDNTYKVYVLLDRQPDYIRPGMAGEARVNIGNRRLGWIWTHRLVDWLRLKLWM